MREIETKIIDFNENDTKKKLGGAGAKYLGAHLFRRWIFDITKKEGEDEFIRIRTNGKITSLTYKFRKGEGMDNTEELEVDVGDFDTIANIISKIVNNNYYQENKVENWEYNNVIISINKWPKIKPVIEVEGKSEDIVKKTIIDIGIEGKEIGNIGWKDLYGRYGLDLHSFKILKFD